MGKRLTVGGDLELLESFGGRGLGLLFEIQPHLAARAPPRSNPPAPTVRGVAERSNRKRRPGGRAPPDESLGLPRPREDDLSFRFWLIEYW
ncbi:hypothetical protein BHM03_00046523 [Ensete ventricosum]|nr:hypothetical protein BHM03_00046523 [Ensete ventricosum]